MNNFDTIVNILDKIANRMENYGELKIASSIDVISNTIEKLARVLPKRKDRPAPIFPKESPKVNDGKDHFPIPDLAHARNALARVNQYSRAPSWYDGTLAQLKKTVVRAVKSKFPSIEIEEEKFKG